MVPVVVRPLNKYQTTKLFITLNDIFIRIPIQKIPIPIKKTGQFQIALSHLTVDTYHFCLSEWKETKVTVIEVVGLCYFESWSNFVIRDSCPIFLIFIRSTHGFHAKLNIVHYRKSGRFGNGDISTALLNLKLCCGNSIFQQIISNITFMMTDLAPQSITFTAWSVFVLSPVNTQGNEINPATLKSVYVEQTYLEPLTDWLHFLHSHVVELWNWRTCILWNFLRQCFSELNWVKLARWLTVSSLLRSLRCPYVRPPIKNQ